MNRNTDERKIETCDCPELRVLFEKMKKAHDLEDRCGGYRAEADLDNPMPGDRRFLEDYKKAAIEFQAAARDYQTEIGNLISRGDLKIKDCDRKKVISCARCGQYIDTMLTSD